MKIIAQDNYGRDHIAEVLVAENVTNPLYAASMVTALQLTHGGDASEWWFRVVEDDHPIDRAVLSHVTDAVMQRLINPLIIEWANRLDDVYPDC